MIPAMFVIPSRQLRAQIAIAGGAEATGALASR
jgi:hypothetical protein